MTRYLALDAFRGITIALMILVNTPGTWDHVYAPLLHADWNGCTPTDLVFPFFLFIIGSAMFFSFRKTNFVATPEQFVRIIKRGFIMFFIGFCLSVLPFTSEPSDWRILGVLQRIGIAYAFAACLVLLLNRRGIFILSGLMLIAYWGLLLSVGSENAYTLEGNIIRQFDLAVLGANHMWAGKGLAFEPEGLISTIPGIVNMLLGFEVTRYLTSISNQKESVIKLTLLGGLAIGIGALWSLVMPINKSLWTSSYVVYTTGFACLLLATFILLIDILKLHKLAEPLLVYGTNPLFVYVLSYIVTKAYLLITIGDISMYAWLFQHLSGLFELKLASFVFAFSHVALFWYVSLVLYKRKIFIKI